MARPGRLPAPGAPHRLGQQLVRPLGRPLVGQVEGDVGRDDADQRHLRDVEPLGHEARPDQHVQPAVREVVQDPVRRALPLDHVPVQAADAQAREPGAKLSLHPLGAAAQVPDPGRPAGRAPRGRWPGTPAVMAAQRRAGLVVDEGPVTVRAGLDVAAIPAHDHGRRPAPVDDEDRPVPGGRVQIPDGPGQRVREEPPVAGGQLGAQVHGHDPRLRTGGTRRQHGAPVPPGTRMAHRLHGRGCAAEHDGGTGEGPERQRRVPGLEARRAVALVGRVVLLVHDDQADVGEGREEGRSGPHDEVHVTGADPSPLVGALPFPEAGVHDGDADRQPGAQPVDDGGGQGDLRDEQQRGAARGEGRRDRLHVDRGLAAAGDAVEEDRRRSRPAIASRTGRRAASWSAVSRDPAGRAPRGPAGRPARGRRGRSRTSARSRPRRTSPAMAAAPWCPARPAAGTPAWAATAGTPAGAPAVEFDVTECAGPDAARPAGPPPGPGSGAAAGSVASSASTARWRGPRGRPAGRSPAASIPATRAPASVSHSRRS